MKKALFINSVCGIGSTGKICVGLAEDLEKQGYACKIAYGRGAVSAEAQKYAVKIGTDLDNYLHVLKTRVLDEHGFGSVKATRRFLEWAEAYKSDLLWIHDTHGYYINVELLFAWIKHHSEMQAKWTHT
jgi:putative colanic acid biosynthesis glycosyltransferase